MEIESQEPFRLYLTVEYGWISLKTKDENLIEFPIDLVLHGKQKVILTVNNNSGGTVDLGVVDEN